MLPINGVRYQMEPKRSAGVTKWSAGVAKWSAGRLERHHNLKSLIPTTLRSVVLQALGRLERHHNIEQLN